MPRTNAWWLLAALLVVSSACRDRPANTQSFSMPVVTDEGAEPIGTCAILAAVIPERPGRSVRVLADTLLMDPRGGREAWHRHGCMISVVDTVSRDGAPVNLLDDWFRTDGWAGVPAYSADGPDGTMFAFEGDGELCVAVGSWDGGDDSDPSAVPAPGFVISVGCVPANPSGTAP